jgi:hypothetical protein
MGSKVRRTNRATHRAPAAVEYRRAVVIAGDCLAVDDARARAQACQRLDDQRVVLDFVQPLAAGRQLIGFWSEGTAR